MKVFASDPQLPQTPVRKICSQFLYKSRLFHSSIQQPDKLRCYYYSSIFRFVSVCRGKPPLKCSAANTINLAVITFAFQIRLPCQMYNRVSVQMERNWQSFYLQVPRDTVEMNSISQHYRTDSLNYQKLRELRSKKAEGLVSQMQNM